MPACILLAMMIFLQSFCRRNPRFAQYPKAISKAALGATREASVLRTVVPAARSGILAAIILGVGRRGETMAVMMVAGNQARMPRVF